MSKTFPDENAQPTSAKKPKLSRQGLNSSVPPHVKKPAYDHTKVQPGILHLGANNFFLAHLGSIVDDVLVNDPNWGIVATSIRTNDVVSALDAQDNLYVMVEREGDERTVRVLAPIVESIFGPENHERVVDYMADERIKVVTICVSNNGYHLSQGGVNLEHHEVAHDLKMPEKPHTIYGYLVRGLQKRSKTGKPLTIMSLDNIPANSVSLRNALLHFVNESNPDLAKWISENVEFPVTTVDRITPKTTDELRQEIEEHVGFTTGVLVGTEKFRQLTVERSKHPTPSWEAVDGVQIVDDCRPYWQHKFFVLNAGHQVAAIIAQRLGVHYIHEAMERPSIAHMMERFHDELATFLSSYDNELAQYATKIRRRFSDHSLGDTVLRVSARTTSKVSERVLTVVERALAANQPLPVVPVFVTACWMLSLGGEDEHGKQIHREDSEAHRLAEIHKELKAWLRGSHKTDASKAELTRIFASISPAVTDPKWGPRFAQLSKNEAFMKELSWALRTINKLGVAEAVIALLRR